MTAIVCFAAFYAAGMQQELSAEDEQILVKELLNAMADLSRARGGGADDEYASAVAFRTVELLKALNLPTAEFRSFLVQV